MPISLNIGNIGSPWSLEFGFLHVWLQGGIV